MKDREEIGRALYLLRAGADPDVFLKTLRAYVVQNSTPEQAQELLRTLLDAQHDAIMATLEPLLRAQKARKAERPKSKKAATKPGSKRHELRRHV